MSGELGTYDIVVGNQGDRNNLDLWYNGGSLVRSSYAALFLLYPNVSAIGGTSCCRLQ